MLSAKLSWTPSSALRSNVEKGYTDTIGHPHLPYDVPPFNEIPNEGQLQTCSLHLHHHQISVERKVIRELADHLEVKECHLLERSIFFRWRDF
jgi:hypothetical protein